MKVSARTQIALKVLTHIAHSSASGRLLQGREIAVRESINETYLAQIMLPLRRAGLVEAVRGRKGGFRLAERPEEITLFDILTVFEGDADGLVGALPVTPSRRTEADVLGQVWLELDAVIQGFARSVTLATVLDRYRAQQRQWHYVI